MDPNETLKRLREIATEVQDLEGIVDYDQAFSLAELVLALDGWIAAGGAFPDDWLKNLPSEETEGVEELTGAQVLGNVNGREDTDQ
jgi:hypothetical protein